MAEAARANVLGVPNRLTSIWGYRNHETSTATFPGRTFQVQRNQPITVAWRNQLIGPAGPLPHLMPVDQTISLQTPTTGVPLVDPGKPDNSWLYQMVSRCEPRDAGDTPRSGGAHQLLIAGIWIGWSRSALLFPMSDGPM